MLRNLKAEAAANERRRIDLETARGKVERAKVVAETTIPAEQLKAAQADREAAEARRLSAERERDSALARIASADATAVEETALRQREIRALEQHVAELERQHAEQGRLFVEEVARMHATQELARIEWQSREKALADFMAKAMAEIETNGAAIKTELATLGTTLRSDLTEIARMPVDLTAHEEKDGTMRATMMRRPA